MIWQCLAIDYKDRYYCDTSKPCTEKRRALFFVLALVTLFIKTSIMKNHLVKLLFEQYKLSSFVTKLSDLGVEIDHLHIDNYEIVLDIIGFPKDSEEEQLKRMEASKALTSYDVKNLPDGFFSRDDLYERYLTTLVSLGAEESIILTHSGLILKKQEDENIVKQELAKHIDWLYHQYESIGNRSLV